MNDLFDKIMEYYKSAGMYNCALDKFFKDYLNGKDVQVIVWYMNKTYIGKIIELSIGSGKYDLLFEFRKEYETIILKGDLGDYQTWWWIVNDKYI